MDLFSVLEAALSLIWGMVSMLLWQQSQRLKITDLPPEILDEIFEFLPQISQGCFALSCRGFYQRFSHIFQKPMFRYPCYDGIDRTINIEARSLFLSRLQSHKTLWSYLTSPYWKYCHSCLKLHTKREFDGDIFNMDTDIYCKMRGIIALCPCLRFTPWRLVRIGHELSKAKFDSDDIRQVIPDWHQCSFVSPCGQLCYSLDISLSLNHKRNIFFHFKYRIRLDEGWHYLGERSIMLCSHVSAVAVIRNSTSPQSKQFNCIYCFHGETISYFEDGGYTITFTKQYPIPDGESYSYSKTDYKWA